MSDHRTSAAKSAEANTRAPFGWRFEYSVLYRRLDWRPTTCDRRKVFARQADALAFVRKLHADGRPDLSPVTGVRIERRYVSQWEAYP